MLVKQPDRVHEHERRYRTLLQVVKQPVAELRPPRTGRVGLQWPLLACPDPFVHRAPRLQQHGAKRQPIVRVEPLVAHRHPEESRVAEGLVGPLLLHLRAEGLGARVDAQDDLRRRATVDGLALAPVGPEAAQQPAAIGPLERREPDLALRILRDQVGPSQDPRRAVLTHRLQFG